MLRIAHLELRPGPVAPANDASTKTGATPTAHLPGSRRHECVVDGDLVAGCDVTPSLEGEGIAHPQVGIARMISAGDSFVVRQKDVHAVADRRAVVLGSCLGDLSQFVVADDAAAEDFDDLTLPNPSGRKESESLDRRAPHHDARIDPAALRNVSRSEMRPVRATNEPTLATLRFHTHVLHHAHGSSAELLTICRFRSRPSAR